MNIYVFIYINFIIINLNVYLYSFIQIHNKNEKILNIILLYSNKYL